jgi:hypothetical protein
MAVKILLSVSLLSWLLLFCSDCGLQGVEASPLSETFPIRLDDLKGFSPKKISVINETLSTNHKAGQRALEIAELYYEGIAVTSYVPANSTLLVIYIDGWIVEAIRGTISWLENPGDFWLIGGPGLDYWGITFETSEEVLGYTYELVAVVSRLVSKAFLLLHEYSNFR